MSLGSDYLRSLLEEDPERGVYRCKRRCSPIHACSNWR